MRFDVNRICELAGLGAASGGLMNEAAAPAAPAKPAAPAAKAPAPAKPAAPAAKAAPAAPAKSVAEEDEYAATDEGDYHEMDHYEGDYHHEMGGHHSDIMDEEMYEIDEYALMEALVDMRQRRLEESNVRDAVREEIQRALSDRSASWVYGSNKPTNSRQGQIARGGFGIGFGFRR